MKYWLGKFLLLNTSCQNFYDLPIKKAHFSFFQAKYLISVRIRPLGTDAQLNKLCSVLKIYTQADFVFNFNK